MQATHIVTMTVKRRSGTTYSHFEAFYNANQVGGKIVFGFMKVADSLDESDLNLFLYPETESMTIYQYGSTFQGRITKIGQVDGAPYSGILDDGGTVEFSIESIEKYLGKGEALEYDEDDEEYDDDFEEEEEDDEDEVPVAHIEGKHLEFNGIPIDGTIDEFCSQLGGIEVIDSDGTDCICSGTYAGRNATFYISANPETGMVYRVIVELEKWIACEDNGAGNVIHADYNEIAEALKEEYGEEFADEQYDYDDGSNGDPDYEAEFMQEVLDGDSTVGTTFQFESDESDWYSKVTIYVEYGHDEDSPDSWFGCVNIGFTDGENEPFPDEDDSEEDEE